MSASEEIARETHELELALLRTGVRRRALMYERCARCSRTPLVGERIYIDDGGAIVCELCQSLEPRAARYSRLMHGPAFGCTIRVLDRRAG